MKLKKINVVTVKEFLTRISTQFTVCCTTRGTYSTDAFERRYTFDIDQKRTSNHTLGFGLTSKDYTLSGFGTNGSEKRFGNFDLIFDEKDLGSDAKKLLMKMLKRVDSSFWKEYKTELTKNNVLVCPLSYPDF